MSKQELKLNPWSKDFWASLLVGLFAGPLSLIFLTNNNIKVSWWWPIIIFPILTVAGIFFARVVSKWVPGIYKFGKFGEVGGLNFLVDLGVINLLVLVSGVAVGLLTVLYKAISFSVAVVNSYLWNKEWVFDDAQKQEQVKQATKFFLASLIGLGVNLLVFVLIKFGGPLVFGSISAKSWVSIGTATGAISGLLFNFILYKIWVFKD